MTNAFLDSRYIEIIERLAFGIEAIDALTGCPVASGVHVSLDPPAHAPLGPTVPSRPQDALVAHGAGRWSIRYTAHTPTELAVRLYDPARQYVPRRLKFTIPTEHDVLVAEQAGNVPSMSQRRWRVLMFPGAAYPISGSATALRGRLRRDGQPVRWARVAATAGGHDVGLAFGDDRGEFLLVVDPVAGDGAELPLSVTLSVAARGPDPAPVADLAAAATGVDPFWDVPVEEPVGSGPEDGVTRGTAAPPHYDPGVVSPATPVPCVLGTTTARFVPLVLA